VTLLEAKEQKDILQIKNKFKAPIHGGAGLLQLFVLDIYDQQKGEKLKEGGEKTRSADHQLSGSSWPKRNHTNGIVGRFEREVESGTLQRGGKGEGRL